MDILAELKKEESKLQQQLDTVRAAMKIWKLEKKSSGKKKKGMSLAAKEWHPRGVLQRRIRLPVVACQSSQAT